MEVWLGALALGLAYAFLGIGVFITMRIFNFPDITADGSLTAGAAVTAALLSAGWSPLPAICIAMMAGFAAGALTGLLHTKLRINGLLAGILVMTALYSVNLRTMGRSNIPLLTVDTVLTPLKSATGWSDMTVAAVLFGLLSIIVILLLSWFFRTDYGLAMRATGDNETMISAQGVSIDWMKIVGIGISNALIALSGSLVAQYQAFADIGMGIGIVVFGLASVIIGETLYGLFSRKFSILPMLVCVITGTIAFRALVAFALSIGLDSMDLKLVTACFVLLAIVLPRLRPRRRAKPSHSR